MTTFPERAVVLEFLMTYGWAILVVLAAIGALAYTGSLDFSTTKEVAKQATSCGVCVCP